MARSDLRWSHLAEQNLLWLYSPSGRIDDAEVSASLAPAGVEVGRVVWPEEMDVTNCLRLTIPFFKAEQIGAAALMGPMSLDVIVGFCRELKGELAALNPGGVLCACCTGRPGARANSLLLVGAFLMLECEKLAADVFRELFTPEIGIKAVGVRFPRPWTPEPQWSPDSLSLADCFFGLEAALQHGWWNYTSHDSGVRRKQINLYDAAPVCTVDIEFNEAGATGRMSLWVAADPVTSVLDPHSRPDPPEEPPIDLKDLKARLSSGTSTQSNGSRIRIKRKMSTRSTGSASSCLNFAGQEFRPVDQWRQRSVGVRSGSKGRGVEEETPRKRTAFSQRGNEERVSDLPSYASWLKEALHCQLIVRANESDEEGLPGGSYDDFFTRWDIPQLDVPFTDGTPPPNGVVETAVERVAVVLENLQWNVAGADCSVVVHCKSGLGRSMSLIGALAVTLSPDLNASAYFGWARLVRPGAIQTAQQERFLRALDEESGAESCARCLRCLRGS